MNIKNLSLSFGVQEVFDDVNLNIGNNEKVGVIGVNGAGKTTFFKVIMGLIQPDSGRIILENNSRIGLLPQVINDEVPSLNINVFDFIMSGRPINELNNELQNVYEEISKEQDEKKQKVLFKKVDTIQQRLEYWDYYSAESILLKIIEGMDISSNMLNKKISELSGGQKSKVAFARLLYSKPELVLLDEPTNHLDEKTKKFVISYLKEYKGSVFVISHDINFLNQFITKTLFLDKRTKKMELYDGNYDNFKKLHEEKEKSLQKQAQCQEREIEHLQMIVDKYSSASGKKKKMAQDREKKLEKLKANKIEVAPQQKKVKINMDMNRTSSDIPLKIKKVCFRYDKSTLLKLIIGQLIPDSGEIYLGNKTDIGYYAQEHELLDNNKTILENFSEVTISQKALRALLGRFLFFDNDVFKKVCILSPGERSRVALAKLSLKGANMLILDEPTNHLDSETQLIIAETFKTFKGTMLIVSHNPDFVDNLGIERTLILPEGELSYYDRSVVEHYHELNSNYNSRKKRM